MADPTDDPLLPWLRVIKNALEDFNKDPNTIAHLEKLLQGCINSFESDYRYQNDVRFLKIWIIHADITQEFDNGFRVMEEKKMFLYHSLLYEAYAVYLEVKGNFAEAHSIYQLGISRKAEPLESLKKMHTSFLNRMTEIVTIVSEKISNKESLEHASKAINPWSSATINDLLREINPQILKYQGYHRVTKNYSGNVPLPTSNNASRNKVINLGRKKYQIKGCSGQGGYAQVFKACVDSNPDDVVALKIQRPPFPWEFYMYRLLDQRIPDLERPSFGFAHRAHVYSDCSILVCDYLDHGTLQDAINSYVVIGQSMEEVLCIYYTIEMLHMLETLHNVSIIHGDFKPDNLLVRYAREELTEDGFHERAGPWRDQGLCLVDWGRGIDLSLFPKGTEFVGSCRTSGFCCTEMQENRPWTFQVDYYGLCVIVHMMLHGTYMRIEKKANKDGSYIYQPKTSLKRYWNVDLWSTLFTKLLNVGSTQDGAKLLQSLRKSFEEYLCGSPQLIKKLKQLLVKQRASLCSTH